MSTLFHAPDSEIDFVLVEISRVLMAGAPFGVGTWFGAEKEGEWTDDRDERRGFTIRSDDVIRETLGRHFSIEHFATVPVGDEIDYQWTVVRRL